MHEVLPHLMARAKRGICPTCGAPLKLDEGGRDVVCDFCGGGASLNFQLRAIEPDAAKVEKAKIKHATRLIAKQATFEPCTCPGCGATFEANTSQSIQTCQYCGAQSKLETRLVPITVSDVEPPKERTREDNRNKSSGRLDHPWDIETEQLFWRIISEPGADVRFNLAEHFESWGFINHTSAHFLPWLLKQIREDDDTFAVNASDVIGKLLCEGDKTLWAPVIQACRGSVFSADGKFAVLHGLGLGTGVCVKTLIDAAEYAAAHGARDYACHALWSVQTLIGRNFEQHPMIAEIVLYRLFYVTGPVLGWALDAMRSSYLRARYPNEVLVHAVDELGIERPELVPHLLECVYYTDAENADEYRTRLGWIRNAMSWGGVAIGFELMREPPGQAKELYHEAVELIDRYLDDDKNSEHAEMALHRLMYGLKHAPAAITRLVEKRGESLSYRVKKQYIHMDPETELLDTSEPYYWRSTPPRELDPEMQKHVEDWKEGIRAAVKERDELYKRTKERRARCKDVPAPTFLRDEPATLELGTEYRREQAERENQETQQNEQISEIERLNQDYTDKIQKLSEQMMVSMDDSAAVQRISAEMTALAEELQTKMKKLMGQ